MGTCTELRQASPNLKPPTYATGWKYGFSDKVVDGVTVSVNSLIINFKSPAFEASLQVRTILKGYKPFSKQESIKCVITFSIYL